jgi:hypothetical protein
MKMVKSLVLGSAAGLLALSAGAQAADLPLKAKAVEYVKVCSLYGAGFYYIPGTDTCLKIGGYTRLDTSFNASGAYDRPAWDGDAGRNSRLRNNFIGRARQDINIDTRTATEYGVVRTYFDAVFQWTTGTDVVSGGNLGVYFAFIQFAGFTIGKAVSQFDVPWTAYPGNNTSFLLGGESNETGIQQIAYTAQFGNGVSASISLEDPSAYRMSGLYNTDRIPAGATGPATRLGLYATGVPGVNSYAGTNIPDIVGQLRVDQAWGLFQVSVAGHEVRASYYGATDDTGHPSDTWGFAAQVGLSLRNLPTGAGDSINFTAGYANGASKYLFSHGGPANFAMYGGSGIAGTTGSIAFAAPADGVFGNGTGIEKSTAWGIRGAFNHNWDPYWSTSLFGAYSSLSWGDNAKGLICGGAVAAGIVGVGPTVCNPDFNVAQIGTVTRWTPVRGLTFSGEVMYTWLDQKNEGVVALPAVGTRPAGNYEFKDQGTLTVGFCAQRNF